MAKRRKKITTKQNHAKRPKGPSCGERVRLMKKNFMELHEAGCTVSKIARMYDLGESTVYDALEEIAAANNISRDSLLWKVKRQAKPAATSTAEPEVKQEPDGTSTAEPEVMQKPESAPIADPEVVQEPESVSTAEPEVVQEPEGTSTAEPEVVQKAERTSTVEPENMAKEYEENQQVLSGLLEIATQLVDTLAQVLEEEKRYA